MKQALENLNKTINKDVPITAKKTVVYDRLKEEEEYLVNNYNRYIRTKKEYDKLQGIEVDVPQEILDEIESQIMPEYLIKQQRQRFMTMLTIISYTTAFLSIIPAINVVGKYSIAITIYPLIRLASLNMPKDKKEKRRYIVNLIHNIVLCASLLINLVLIVIVYNRVLINGFLITSDVFYVTGPIFLILLFIKLFIVYRTKSKKRKRK